MINFIWGFFIIIGIVYSFFTGININNTLLVSTSDSVDLIFKLLPLMCLWLGVMNIAIESGLLNKLSKFIIPILKKIFPELKNNPNTLTLIASNIVMNMIGLGNAATPFGLKTMKSLQELNNKKDEATRSMITFLVINTASVTIVPTTIISLRIMHGSTNPTEILLASIITSFFSCFLGLLLDRAFYYFRSRHECI